MRWPATKRRMEELVRAHYMGLYAFAFRLSGSRQEAEDLTQEAFCQAQAKLAQLRDPARARQWLFTILRNLYLHSLRHSRREKTLSLDGWSELPERSPELLPEVDPAALQQALLEMPEAFRTPVILFYFEDFSYRDIAEQLEVPLGTVMSRLARARAWLKERLQQSVALIGVQGAREGL